MNYNLILIIVLIAIIILLRIYFPQIKGALGENRIKKQLNKLPDNYKTLHDITLRSGDKLTQIDHLVIAPYGVFVIETKNYTGWIFGNEKSEYWTQTIYKNKTRFRNPIKQNWAHVFSLRELLSDYDKNLFIPIVVFAGDCKLKNVQAQTEVVYDENLYNTLSSYHEIKLKPEEVEKIYNNILNNAVQEKDAKKQHIKDIKAEVKERTDKEKMQICPRCEGELVEKQGKYGSFMGCSDYPKCKYTKNMR